MKQFKKLILSALSFGLCLSLTSCDNLFKIIGVDQDENVTLGEYAEHSITLNQLNKSSSIATVPSVGNSKLLVVPVYFSDYTPEKLGLDETEVIDNLNKGFFGESNVTGWESVSSFYKKSSYGKLNLTGMVTDLFNVGETLKYVMNKATNEEETSNVTYYILDKVNVWLKEKYDLETLKSYDTDNDGYIDGIWLVYLNKYLNGETNKEYYKEHEGWANGFETRKGTSDYINYQKFTWSLWAYTYWRYYEDNEIDASSSYPYPHCYAWASYDFFKEGGYTAGLENKTLVDSHTFIHETGHMLGLDDYYSYDGVDAPVGGLCMMDNNIGDHEAFSKYLLSWVEPKIVQEAGSFTLKPFEDSGECLLVPARVSNFNNSPYSEYLLIEYYTPTGLNELDATNEYASGARMFTKPGILVYHIDARLVKVTGENNSVFVNKYTDPSSVSYVIVGASNTPSKSLTEKRLVKLISSKYPTGKYSTGLFNSTTQEYCFSNRSNYRASDIDLFKVGDKITSFNFNMGTYLRYDISVDNIDTNSATISFA
jgi:M6 family metalloprotease-like protein